MSLTHGTIWWNELRTTDVSAALSYYRALFGWQIERRELPSGPYWVAVAHGRAIAGIAESEAAEGETDPRWLPFVAVDDVEAAMQETEAAGGRILRPAADVAGVGRIGLAADPSGAPLGLIRPVLPPLETGTRGTASLDNVPV